MKQCTKCKQWKPRNEFYAQRRNRDGLKSWCKRCEIDYAAWYQKTDAGKACRKRYDQTEKAIIRRREVAKTPKRRADASRYNSSEKGKLYQRIARARHPDQRKARDAVNNAVKRGYINPASAFLCSHPDCNQPAQEYHHYLGYDQAHWFDVQPYCVSHHRMIDNS